MTLNAQEKPKKNLTWTNVDNVSDIIATYGSEYNLLRRWLLLSSVLHLRFYFCPNRDRHLEERVPSYCTVPSAPSCRSAPLQPKAWWFLERHSLRNSVPALVSAVAQCKHGSDSTTARTPCTSAMPMRVKATFFSLFSPVSCVSFPSSAQSRNHGTRVGSSGSLK